MAKLRKLEVKLNDALLSLKSGREGNTGAWDDGVKFPVLYSRMAVVVVLSNRLLGWPLKSLAAM